MTSGPLGALPCCALLLALSASPASAPAQTAAGATSAAVPASAPLPGEPLDAVIAVVNNQPILESALDQRMAQVSEALQANGTALPPTDVLRKQVLERLISQQLELQAADNQGIQVSADQINQALSNIASRHGLTLAQLPKALAAQGRDYLAFRNDIKDQLTVHRLLQQVVAAQVVVSPVEVDNYLKRQDNATGGNVEYQLAQILVAFPPNATPKQVQATRDKADALVAKLKAGADFAATAVANSGGPHALEGGMIGWIKAANLPTLFVDVVPTLKAGEISAPIAGVGGYHIVKLVAQRSATPANMGYQYHVLHILLKPNPVRDLAQCKALAQTLHDEILAGKLSFAGAAKQYSDDPSSAGSGGDIDWASLADLPPEFGAVIKTLPENKVSDPIESPLGWHLIEVLGKRSRNLSHEQREHQAYQAIFQRKMADQVAEFTRVLRSQAYVDIFDAADGGSGSGD